MDNVRVGRAKSRKFRQITGNSQKSNRKMRVLAKICIIWRASDDSGRIS
jgi:hypothetical protein